MWIHLVCVWNASKCHHPNPRIHLGLGWKQKSFEWHQPQFWHCPDAGANESRRKSHHRPPDQQAWTWLQHILKLHTDLGVLRCFLPGLKCELCTYQKKTITWTPGAHVLHTFCMTLSQHLKSAWYFQPTLEVFLHGIPFQSYWVVSILRSAAPLRCCNNSSTRQQFIIANPRDFFVNLSKNTRYSPSLLGVFSDVSPFGMRIWSNTFSESTSDSNREAGAWKSSSLEMYTIDYTWWSGRFTVFSIHKSQ